MKRGWLRKRRIDNFRRHVRRHPLWDCLPLSIGAAGLREVHHSPQTFAGRIWADWVSRAVSRDPMEPFSFPCIDRVDLIVLLLRHAWLSAYFDQRSDFRLGVSTNILPLFRFCPCITHSSSHGGNACSAFRALWHHAPLQHLPLRV